MPNPWTTSASASLVGGGATITVVDGSTFCIAGASGDFQATLPQGLFFQDTRFLSGLVLRCDGDWPETLESDVDDPFSAVFVSRLAPRAGHADSDVLVVRHRYVGRGMRDDIEIHNFGAESVCLSLELAFEADFADLFEVKSGRVETAGSIEVEDRESGIAFLYERNGFRRETWVDFSRSPHLRGATATFEAEVPPQGTWELCVQVSCSIQGDAVEPLYSCGQPVEHSTPSARLERWRTKLPTLDTEHDAVRALYRRSTEDLAALRIFDPDHPDRAVVAAGAPWFMTLFGRDSLFTSWMSMLIDSDVALGTLQTLASLQGEKVDEVTEEQPGRILHEVRFGETAHLSLGGGSAYYGSVDATPLFVMMVGELSRWGNKRDQVDALLPAADRALDWIRDYGDRDGDGYVEYQRLTDHGLRNQGWKDSEDGVRFADGRLAEAPIALAEVQGYVYGALAARAHCAAEAGDSDRAERLWSEAADLKDRFNRDFWIESLGRFAMALDGDKRQVDALVSNLGHLLWTGIVDSDKASTIAAQLVGPELFSGWGVRTLGAQSVGYNPIGYHIGTVWPHDNAIAAAGLMRYGFVKESTLIIETMVEASVHFDSRLPELFSGLARRSFPFPVAYPTSCSPQAWAAAAPLLFLRTLLRFEPDLRHGRLHLAPVMPEWMGPLRMDRIPVLGGHLSIEVEGSHCEILSAPHGVEIVHTPREA